MLISVKAVALVHKPRVNLSHHHGVLALDNKNRVPVTPTKWAKDMKVQAPDGKQDQSPALRRGYLALLMAATGRKRKFTVAEFKEFEWQLPANSGY